MRKLLFVIALLCAPGAFAQGQRQPTMALSPAGRPLAGAIVYVCTGDQTGSINYSATPPCSPEATIYSDPLLTDPITQPLLTNQGNYSYYGPAEVVTEVVQAQAGVTGYAATINLGIGLAPNTANTFTAAQSFTGSSPRTFINPAFGTFGSNSLSSWEFQDASSDSSSMYAQGDSHFLPYLNVNLMATGTGEPIPAYFVIDNRGDQRGRSPVALFSGCFDGWGSTISGCWGYNNIASLQAGYTISSISQSGGTTTAVLTIPGGFISPIPYQTGDVIDVQGVMNSAYDGIFTIATINTGTNTITYSQTGSNSSSSGGTLTKDAAMFGTESNLFNNLGDPGDFIPQASNPKYGLVATNSGTYPIHVALFSTYSEATSASSPTYGNRPYYGEVIEDAINAGITIGDISSTSANPNGPLKMAQAIRVTEMGTATSGMNYGSPPISFGTNYWNGSMGVEKFWKVHATAGAGSNPGLFLNFDIGGSNAGYFDSGGDLVTTGNVEAGTSVVGATYQTGTNCSSSASPAVCGAAPAGSFVVAAAATTVVVDTSAVTASSQILITPDSSLGTKLSVTCNTTAALLDLSPWVSARTAGTSFTVTLDGAPSTNPECFSYMIIN